MPMPAFDSFDLSQESECPLCMEEFDMTDRNLKPCKCGYQVCLWCLNKLMETANGEMAKCPNCRRPYDQKNFDFKPLDPKEIRAEKTKQRSKKRQGHKSRKSLANVRVIQRNLVYVVGLTLNVAKEQFLGSKENFAKYGKISKLVVNTTNLQRAAAQGREPTVSAYITYERAEDARKAIQAVDSTWIDGKMLRASFGTTKYCAYFLRNIQCTNPDCMYLHEYGHDEDTFTKEDIVLRNGLPTPTGNSQDGNHPDIYSALKDTQDVNKHYWNYPRSNNPPNARPGATFSETTSFWDVSDAEGGEYEAYEGYEGEYYDEDDTLEETSQPEEPAVPVAIANSNQKASSDSSLPSTARWGIQPAQQKNGKKKSQQLAPSSSKQQHSTTTTTNSTTTTSTTTTTTTTTSFNNENTTPPPKQSKNKNSNKKASKKSKKTPPSKSKNEPSKRGPVMIQEPDFDKPKKSSASKQESKADKNTKPQKVQPVEVETPIDSLKMLNAESTPLPTTVGSSPTTSVPNKSPADMGLYGHTSPSAEFPTLSGAVSNGATPTDDIQKMHQQHHTHNLSQQYNQQPHVDVFTHHHQQHQHHHEQHTSMSGVFLPNGTATPTSAPEGFSAPSLWSSMSSTSSHTQTSQQQQQGDLSSRLTQSRFAYSSEDSKNQPQQQQNSMNQSRFAQYTHHDMGGMQETLRSLLPNVKVNFSYNGGENQQDQRAPLLQQQQQQQPSQQWGSSNQQHPQNININIHNTNYIQNNHQQYSNGPFGYDYSGNSSSQWGGSNYSYHNTDQHQQSSFGFQ